MCNEFLLILPLLVWPMLVGYEPSESLSPCLTNLICLKVLRNALLQNSQTHSFNAYWAYRAYRAYKILTELFWVFRLNIALWEFCLTFPLWETFVIAYTDTSSLYNSWSWGTAGITTSSTETRSGGTATQYDTKMSGEWCQVGSV